MSQARKTTFITLVFILGTSLLGGCGISGPLYAPDTDNGAGKVQPSTVATPASESADSNVSEVPNGEVE